MRPELRTAGRTLVLSLIGLSLLFSFQNCGQGFSVTEAPLTQSGLQIPLEAGSCTFNNLPLANGDSTSGYSSLAVPFGSSCSSVLTKVTCKNGVLNPPNAFGSCSVTAAASCNFNGQVVASGTSIKAYQAGMVPSGSACVSQNRTCTNGTLDGSYTFANCTVGAPASCPFNGQQIPSGGTAKAFSAASVPYGSSCASVATTVTCTNGALNPSTAYPSCVVSPAAACSFNGMTVASGSSVQGYKTATVPYSTSCSSVATYVTCTNGTLSPANAVASCKTLPSPYTFLTVPQGLPGFSGLASNYVVDLFAAGATLYVATNAGLSISNDEGQTFVTRTTANGLGNNYIDSVYASGLNVYAGTEAGLSVSTDGGKTFINRTIVPGNSIQHVHRVVGFGSNLYVGTVEGLFISTDGAKTFKVKTGADGLGSNNIFDIFADGPNVYVATDGGLSLSTDGGNTFINRPVTGHINSVVASGSTIYLGTEIGLQITSDGGRTFVTRTAANGLGGHQINKILISGSTIYACTYDRIYITGGLSISTDGGNTFTNTSFKDDIGNKVAANAVAIVGTKIFVGTPLGLPISADGGSSFVNKLTTGIGSNDFSDIAASDTTLYVTDKQSGLYISSNNGQTFVRRTKADGLGSTWVTSVIAVGTNVYVGTASGLSISTDGGNTFETKHSYNGLAAEDVEKVAVAGSNVYAITGLGISISVDGGKSFTTAQGISGRAYSIYATGSQLFVGTSSGLFISNDQGKTFVNKILLPGVEDQFIQSISGSGPTVYVTANATLVTSLDGGNTFTQKKAQAGFQSVNIVGSTSYLGTYSNGIGISADEGESFIYLDTPTGVGNNWVMKAVVLGKTIFAITSGGLSRSN